VQATCTGAGNQTWQAVRTGNTFALRNVNSGYCAAINATSDAATRADGANVAQYACDGSAYGQWMIEALRANDYELAYQASKGRIAWQSAPSSASPIAVTVDGTRPICRSTDSTQWLGVVSGSQCVGKDYAGRAVSTTSFLGLYQAN
jgi:hypothetical protein